MSACRYAITELLPHRPPMILLDRVEDFDADMLTASVTITPLSLFCASGSVPSHIALEYMAQACGAHVGIIALEKDEAVRIGFVLGTRDFVCKVPGFAIGETLDITVTLVFNDAQMGAYDCRIAIGDRLVAKARLSVYQPELTGDGTLSESPAP
jgi:predicted hotdog family 3-hydroxylacyl-ACP dehydratase